MAEAIQLFQAQLINKLQYKASSKVSHDAFLFKCFKFFDLYNNGYLARTDFFKAMAKCGVVVDVHDMETIFNHYDRNNEGRVYYKEFIQQLLFREEQSSSKISKSSAKQSRPTSSRFVEESRNMQQPLNEPLSHSHLKINKEIKQYQTFTEILQCVRQQLSKESFYGIISLANKLKSFDRNRSHTITFQELKQCFPYLTESNILMLLQGYNLEKENINYAQLVYKIKDRIEQDRTDLILEVFDSLDTKKEGEIPIQNLLNSFRSHLDKQQFSNAINTYCSFQGIDDGFFTSQDFCDFLDFISYSFQDNQGFFSFMQRAFFVEEDRKSNFSNRSNRSRNFNQSKVISASDREQQQQIDPVVQEHHQGFLKQKKDKKEDHQHSPHQKLKDPQQESEHKKTVSRYSQHRSEASHYIKNVQSIIIRIKKRLASKGTKGFLVFEKALKQADSNNDGLVNYDEFKKVIKDLRIDISSTQASLVFDVFDQQATGYVNFSELVYTLKGQLPDYRRRYIQKLWQMVKNNEEQTTLAKIRHVLSFRGHPDVQTGRRDQEEVLKEILETFQLIQQLNYGGRREEITKREFQEYGQNLSLSIIDDQLFETYMNNFWRVLSTTNIEDQYAGSRKIFDHTKKGYLVDHHRYAVTGGSVSQNAPFGTFTEPTVYFTEHHKL